jgi:hypothetical protein
MSALLRAGQAAMQGARRTRALWEPHGISGGLHFYRGDSVVLVSSRLHQWPDQIGSETLEQSAPGDRPLMGTLGGRVAADFGASAEWVHKVLAAPLPQPWYFWAVVQSDTTSGTRVVGTEAGAGGWLAYMDGGDWNFWAGAELDGPVPTLGMQLLIGVANGASGKFMVDNIVTPVATGNVGTNALDKITVGASETGNFAFDGRIAEIGFGSGDISASADLVRLARYVNRYYGMSVVLP